MQRQCAWCLRLMDNIGERISSLPVPKIYEASHGMCKTCGNLWLEQVMQEPQLQAVTRPLPMRAEVSRVY
jgi:hypothetical protein